jgi:hypothetical protein
MSARHLLFLAAASLGLIGCSVEGVSPDPIEPPFAVSDYFVPSGFMGDGSLTIKPKPLELFYDGCRPRPANARGNCYRFAYRPVPLDEGGVGWAGVYWQSPANNWGQDRPQRVVPSASRVSFVASGGDGGENLTILIGGLDATDPDGDPLPYRDTLSVSQPFTLTTEPTRYDVPLPEGVSYDFVVGAFGFSLASDGAPSRALFLDVIAWLED